MLKAKKYDWKDSNMALFGSDTEKKVKKESAESEPAWQGAGQKVGVQIWRIVKFKVTKWDEDQYGEFYNGDSYIILNTYKDPDGEELLYDVHFWIGSYSTQDEYGTAAYKTVELDTFLDDKPVQHREVQGHESSLFKSYFKTFTLLKGGADTGFRRVLPESYAPRLLHVKREIVTVNGKERKVISCNEIPLKRGNLTSDDVFIIDNGRELYQYNGSKCSADEKFKAAQEMADIKARRRNTVTDTLDERTTSANHPALMVLKDGKSKEKQEDKKEKKMFRVTDSSGKLKVEEIADGDSVSRSLLKDEDVFIINTGDHCYCWIGKGASIDERKNGLSYASNYLNQTARPYLPITVVSQGRETADFNNAF